MTRTRRAFAALACCVIVASAVTATTVAFWAGGGTGNALVSAGNLAPPGAPDVAVDNGSATLTWDAADADGAGPIRYWVQRRLGSGSMWSDACGTTATSGASA